MNRADKKAFLQKLHVLRARLTGEVQHLSNEAFRSKSEGAAQAVDVVDVGSDAYEQEVTISMLQSEEGVLTEINEAIERIGNNSYGMCDSCGKIIPKPRLNAIPYAKHCVNCAKLSEISS